ncbi:hypothetical protein Pcinc_018039 [Petrolisthes cinctipes]|uniref:MAPK regulated corepressor interacting protein 2 n=1 Tax=Petrolisthes cinctipes TaxID=88211 RepID=A0AAE1KP87_PETCI|nr:hypothetical protein Pcinc_018039 [Petrolisthes cinctipes]
MYKISGIRSRRDANQKLENLDQIRELTRDADQPTMSSPRPVFQPVGGGGKSGRSTNGRPPPQDVITPQHDELIRFFHESWGRVCKELEMGKQNGHDGRGSGITYYEEKSEHPALHDFKPFDLEAYWGKRLYQNLTQST